MMVLTLIAIFMKVSASFAQFVVPPGAPFPPIALHPAVQQPTSYSVIPLPNAVLSAPVSAFIQTARQGLHPLNNLLLLPQLTPANIRQALANGAFISSTLSGSVDPSPFVAEMNKNTQKVLPFTNLSIEEYAGSYAIAKTLESKGLLPDVNTAVGLANDYVKTLLSHTNELAPGALWDRVYDASVKGIFDFLSKHIHVTINDLALIRDIYFSQLQ